MKNVVDLHPIPSRMRISREAWIATPEVVRDEIIRAWQEQEQGLAVQKDRYCGRKNSHRTEVAADDSFCALHRLEMALWRRPDDATLQAKADAMRERLKPDAERHKAMLNRDKDLTKFHQMAKRQGKSLPDVLREYIGLENMIRQEPVRGLDLLARRSGVDFAEVLTVVAAGVHLAHCMLLRGAADMIRDQPDEDWDGRHFGFMADEVERVRPECVTKINGYRAVDYERLSKTPEAKTLCVYHYLYKDGGDGSIPQDAA